MVFLATLSPYPARRWCLPLAYHAPIPVRDAGGAIILVRHLYDIEDLKRAGEALRESESRISKLNDFRETIIRTAAEGICVCCSVPHFPFVEFSVWNEQMTELTGYTQEEINRLGWYQSLYPDLENARAGPAAHGTHALG